MPRLYQGCDAEVICLDAAYAMPPQFPLGTERCPRGCMWMPVAVVTVRMPLPGSRLGLSVERFQTSGFSAERQVK